MTTESDNTRKSSTEPARPVIEEEMVERLMAQVDAEGLELLGPDGVVRHEVAQYEWIH